MKKNTIDKTTQKAGAKAAMDAIESKRPRMSVPVPTHRVNDGQTRGKDGKCC